MKQTRILMGMPITVEVLTSGAEGHIDSVFDFFAEVDERYSTYKPTSEISRINAGLDRSRWSEEVQTALALCEETKKLTDGYFDIERDGQIDPSGLVKGWAIHKAAEKLAEHGARNFYIEAGGDIQVGGTGPGGKPWTVGIRNPFKLDEIVKVLRIDDEGVATSGNYIRGAHVYNPKTREVITGPVVSLTVIGPNVYEADRFATAAYAMGEKGIYFIEKTPGLEGYAIDLKGIATMTKGFGRYVQAD